MTSETIVAVSTPPGRGGIGIVRVSGAATRTIVKALTGLEPVARVARYCRFTAADGDLIDHGVLTFFVAPASYTGEDVAEFQAHGNPWLLQQLVAAACSAGARPARAGEFTQRAFLNGKLDLAQAEAVADLIASNSARAARAASRSLEGAFSARVQPLIDTLHGARAEIEAAIDFADDVMGPELINKQAGTVAALCRDIEQTLANATTGMRLNSGATVAIIGAPNVGKSSLLNCLAGADRAIVSDRPGTTRDVVGADLEALGVPFTLLDTAGLHETPDALEKEGIRRSRDTLARADLVLLVTDTPALADSAHYWAALGEARPDNINEIVVHNKIDLHGLPAGTRRVDDLTHVFVSALHATGSDELRAAMATAIGVDAAVETEFSARERHLDALRSALTALQSIDPGDFEAMPELAAEHYRVASHALEAISGRYTTEDLLGDIFDRFCIGK